MGCWLWVVGCWLLYFLLSFRVHIVLDAFFIPSILHSFFECRFPPNGLLRGLSDSNFRKNDMCACRADSIHSFIPYIHPPSSPFLFLFYSFLSFRHVMDRSLHIHVNITHYSIVLPSPGPTNLKLHSDFLDPGLPFLSSWFVFAICSTPARQGSSPNPSISNDWRLVRYELRFYPFATLRNLYSQEENHIHPSHLSNLFILHSFNRSNYYNTHSFYNITPVE